jgi:hypothetical protein
LDDHGRGVPIEKPVEGGDIDPAGFVERNRFEPDIDVTAVGPGHLLVVRMDTFRQQHPGSPLHPAAEQHRLRQRRGPVIKRGVRHLHAGELANHGLVLEHRLQGALADFRLVGGVGRVELRPGEQMADDRGNVVPVGPGSQKAADLRHRPVSSGQPPGSISQLRFRMGRRQVQWLLQAQPRRYGGKQILDPFHADRSEHLAAIGVTDGNVGHQAFDSAMNFS